MNYFMIFNHFERISALDRLCSLSHHHSQGHHVRPSPDPQRGTKTGGQIRRTAGMSLPTDDEKEHDGFDGSHLQADELFGGETNGVDPHWARIRLERSSKHRLQALGRNLLAKARLLLPRRHAGNQVIPMYLFDASFIGNSLVSIYTIMHSIKVIM